MPVNAEKIFLQQLSSFCLIACWVAQCHVRMCVEVFPFWHKVHWFCNLLITKANGETANKSAAHLAASDITQHETTPPETISGSCRCSDVSEPVEPSRERCRFCSALMACLFVHRCLASLKNTWIRCLVSMEFLPHWMHLFIQFAPLKTVEHIRFYRRTDISAEFCMHKITKKK